ncbi:UDP-glucose 4-epimerase GalE [Candidatus Saccharibacteria bacterium]|nr:UDP-glucose 4-epimerase GalE [Candidatus Saccharibacteria bacterium]
MKILLTGGTGYIGSHTAVELIEQGYEVEILDNLFNSKLSVLDDIEKITGVKPKFCNVDLTDFEATEKVIRDGGYDVVMHFAGLKAVGESVEKPLLYYKNNVGGTINLLTAMKKYGVKKIIFSSSATVYGDPGDPKYVETMETGRNLANPYGKTKYMIEEMIKDMAVAWPDFSAVILRYFNPVGNHESGLIGENPNGIPNNLMPIIMKVARGEIPELSIYGNDYPTPDGTCKRDYIHVVDLARGHVAAMKALMQNGVFIYNLGSGKPLSVFEVVAAFEKASGKKLPYKIVARRAGDLAEFYAEPSKTEKELGFKAELTIDDAMRDTIKFLEKYEKE